MSITDLRTSRQTCVPHTPSMMAKQTQQRTVRGFQNLMQGVLEVTANQEFSVTAQLNIQYCTASMKKLRTKMKNKALYRLKNLKMQTGLWPHS